MGEGQAWVGCGEGVPVEAISHPHSPRRRFAAAAWAGRGGKERSPEGTTLQATHSRPACRVHCAGSKALGRHGTTHHTPRPARSSFSCSNPDQALSFPAQTNPIPFQSIPSQPTMFYPAQSYLIRSHLISIHLIPNAVVEPLTSRRRYRNCTRPTNGRWRPQTNTRTLDTLTCHRG